MDDLFFFPEINQEKCQQTAINKRQIAQNLYLSLQKGNKVAKDNRSEPSPQEESNLSEKEVLTNEGNYGPEVIQKRPVTNEHALIILQGLSLGINLKKTRVEYPILEKYPIKQLKNVPRVTLLKISKIFIELLPEKSIFLTPFQFFQKYFRTSEMLKFFKSHNLNLIPTFQNLFFIKNWQKNNNEYLKRGYARDYLPKEITQKLLQLPNIYEEMKFIYDNFGYKLKNKQKWKKNVNEAKPIQFSMAQQATQTGMQEIFQSKSPEKDQFF